MMILEAFTAVLALATVALVVFYSTYGKGCKRQT